MSFHPASDSQARYVSRLQCLTGHAAAERLASIEGAADWEPLVCETCGRVSARAECERCSRAGQSPTPRAVRGVDPDESARLAELWQETREIWATHPRRTARAAPAAPAPARPEKFAAIAAGLHAERLGREQGLRFDHDPEIAASVLHLQVEYVRNLHDDSGQRLMGRIFKDYRLIQLDADLRPGAMTTTLAHEIGHYLAGETEDVAEAFQREFLRRRYEDSPAGRWEAMVQAAAERRSLRS